MKTIKNFIAILVFSILTFSVWATPAFPELVAFRQPRGEKIVHIFLKGDERVHWAESEDGYSLLHSDDGSLVYAMLDEHGDMVPSSFLATDIKERSKEVNEFLASTPKHLLYSPTQVKTMKSIWQQVEQAKQGPKTMTNVLGEKKFLVILFGFQDKEFTFGKMAFQNLFNQVNYSLNGATGSVHDYYYDVSGGQFSLSVDVVGPYIGVHNTAHYGDDSGYQDFAREAVDSAAQDVNFADYDNDGDGYIDGLHIIFAGYGEEAGASSDCIWSHKWNIFNPPTYNNTVIDVYSCSPECSGNWGANLTAIGVICHELGHVFGAPDYYDTDYAGSGGQYQGLGNWDIMSGGSWNHGGRCPAHHNPYTKIYIYHWGTCDTLDATPQVVALPPAYRSLDGFHRINTATEGDFFLIENRERYKWDRYIPGNGMLVYHVHPDAHGAYVDNSRHPQQLYIMGNASILDTFPSSTPSSYGYISDNTTTFPTPYHQRDSLTDFSIPWFRPWSKQRNYTPFYNIARNDDDSVVYFCVGTASFNPLNATAEGVSNSQIAVDWTRYGSYSTLILINEENTFGTPDTTYQVGDTVAGGGRVLYYGTGNGVLAEDLTAGQTYYFMAYSRSHADAYSKGQHLQAATLNCGETWTSEDFEQIEGGALPACWSGDWKVDTGNYSSHVLSSCRGCQSATRTWFSVTSAPFSFDTLHSAVLRMKLHFDDDCDEETLFRVECYSQPGGEWVTLKESAWRYGLPAWDELYIHLPQVGVSSRLRFSLFTDGRNHAAIDDIQITEGCLLHASCDGNGSISPYGYTIVDEQAVQTFTITPLPGYKFARLEVNGVRVQVTDTSATPQYELTATGFHDVYAIFEASLGIEDAAAEELNLYPNPTSGLLTVETAPGQTLTLYDLKGQRMMQTVSGEKLTVIDLSAYPRGIYLLRCEGAIRKVVKK